MKVSNPALHTQIQSWADKQGIKKPLHDLSLQQLQRASRSLGADLSDVIQLRAELVANAAGTAMDAGQATAKDRAAAQGGMPIGMKGSQDIARSPLLARHTYDAGKGGKGVGFSDAGAAMGSFAARYDSKMRNVKFDSYIGGSPDIDAFYKSGYSIADAEQLMKSYPAGYIDTLWDAKELIGFKAREGHVEVLQDYGITTSPYDKHEEMSAFENSGYDNYDARQALAAFPFLSDLDDAKRYIGLKVMNGTEDILSGVGIHGTSRPPVELYLKSEYNYDDAEAVMEHFGMRSVTQAKEYIGTKIATGNEDILYGIGVKPADHTDSYQYLMCFYKSGYSVEDAEKVMEAYSLSDLGEAKELIGEKAMNGFTRSLNNLGVTPYADLHDGLAAFHNSPYTEADARALVAMTNMFDNVQDARAYIGEKIINGGESFLKDLGITRFQYDAHECLNAFGNSDYTGDDVDLAVKRLPWIDSADQAREYIGLKILAGNEDILLERGIGTGGKDYGFNPKGGWNDKGGFYAGKGHYSGWKK